MGRKVWCSCQVCHEIVAVNGLRGELGGSVESTLYLIPHAIEELVTNNAEEIGIIKPVFIVLVDVL